MTALPLTADLCARALIAACQITGDNPVRALTAKRGIARRGITPAVDAVVIVTKADPAVVCRAFGYQAASYDRARRKAASGSGEWAVAAAVAAVHDWAGVHVPAPVGPAIPKSLTGGGAAKVDHTSAIKAALERRKAVQISVAGVEKDRDLLKAGAGGCHAHQHLNETPVCDAPAVSGRLFCVGHCEALGQRSTPVRLTPTRTARPYYDRGAD